MIIFIIALIFVLSCFAGAQYARMDGGGGPKTPELTERLLCIGPFVAPAIFSGGWWGLLALIGMVGLAIGHGPYFLDRLLKGLGGDMPGVDFIVRWIFGPDWRAQFPENHIFTTDEEIFYQESVYPGLLKRNLFGLSLSGFLVGAPAGIICICFGDIGAGISLMLTAFIKPWAYWISYPDTKPGELLNGTVRSALALVVLLLLYFAASW